MERFERQLREAGPAFTELIEKVPLQDSPPLRPAWLRCEMLERHQVLERAPLVPGSTVLEVGSGPHATSTVPLAFALGPRGRVVAAERSRWGQFRRVVVACEMQGRVFPVACDARHLPFRTDSADLAVCIHGVRSLENEENIEEVFREMLRVAPRLFVAESLPIATSKAQRAHLDMYGLREEVFRATLGRPDDLAYFPLERLASLVMRAGGVVEGLATVDVDLPHALAYFPRSMVEAAPPGSVRDSLMRRWDEAHEMNLRYGADHPPVGFVLARRP